MGELLCAAFVRGPARQPNGCCQIHARRWFDQRRKLVPRAIKRRWNCYAIHVTLKSDSEITEITIEDDGNGYPKDVLSKIGEQF